MLPRSSIHCSQLDIWPNSKSCAKRKLYLICNYVFITVLFGCALFNSILFSNAAQNDVWQVLREGGVVLIRHAQATGKDDPYTFRLGNCSTQPKLSEDGRSQARRIGAQFQEHSIEVGIVLHSRWCRTKETASLAFPGITFSEPHIDSFRMRPENESFHTKKTKEMIGNWSGSNALVLMTHQENIAALTGVNVVEAEGVVLRTTDGNVEVIGRVSF